MRTERRGTSDPNRLFYALGYFTEPATLRGTIFLVHEPVDQVAEQRSAWIYNSGQRRVRRAPDLAYDGINDGSEGMIVTDQVDGYNGAPDRFDWKLLGKREMYIPYNTYKLSDKSLRYKDIVGRHTLNADLVRYELHRVWVVEATLKPASVTCTGSARSTSTKTAGASCSEDAYDTAAGCGAWRCSAWCSTTTPWCRGTASVRYHDLTSGGYIARRPRQRNQGTDPVQRRAKVMPTSSRTRCAGWAARCNL
jgi:hypothetical protein